MTTLRVGSVEFVLDTQALLWGVVACLFVVCVYYASKYPLWLKLPSFSYHKKLVKKWRARRARRELEMTRKREEALKAQVADAVIRLLLYRVRKNMMTLQRSYDVQTIVARAVKCEELLPRYDQDTVKQKIKARVSGGANTPVKLPDAKPVNRRGQLLKLINGGK